MTRVNCTMAHLKWKDELSKNVFNAYVREKDTEKICKEFSKKFNKCIDFHHGDFRFCGSEYFKLTKCMKHYKVDSPIMESLSPGNTKNNSD